MGRDLKRFLLNMIIAGEEKQPQKGTLGSNMLFWSYSFLYISFGAGMPFGRFIVEYDFFLACQENKKRCR